MPRVIDSQVREIIGTAADVAMTPFIAYGNGITNQLHAADTKGLADDATLKEIERWLAAHAYTTYDQQFSAKTTGKASATFQGQTTQAFSSTFYGQRAMELDPTGWLARKNQEIITGNSRKASIGWLGKEC